MATIKSYTDINQSKKLAEIIPLESADMYYVLIDTDEDKYDAGLGKYIGILPHYPCWSLAALLGIIPNYKLSSEHNYHTCTAETSFGKETVAWFDNPVDACVAMVEKLNELKLL